MMRASIYLPEALHQRLQIASKQTGQSISTMVRTLLDKALSTEEEARLKDVYRAFENVKGICKDPVTDASTTIDETLYGEHAWRGSHPYDIQDE